MEIPHFNQKFALKYPIIQAPMAGAIVTSDFVARVSSFGMLGSIASGYLTLSQIEQFIVEVKNRTSNPFQLNIFVDYQNNEQRHIPKPKEVIAIEKKIGIHKTDSFDVPKTPTMAEIIDLVIRHKVPIVSTTFGTLKTPDIKKLKDNGVSLMSTVNSIEEAEIAISRQSSDVIVFQSREAGGHKGGFLDNPYGDSLSIIRLKKEYPRTYFVKSGAIVDKSDIQETLNQGYDAVQIGTGFLMTKESAATELYKEILLKADHESQIITTENITGKKARGIGNELAKQDMINRLPYPLLHYATKEIRDFSKKNGIAEYQSFWTGDGVIKINSIPNLKTYMTSLV